MTNLEKAGSLRRALETYPEPSELLNFKEWCAQKAASKIPDWITAGQWFKNTSDNTYNRITIVKGDIVECSNRGVFWLKNFCTPNTNFVPVQIKPWTLAQTEKIMKEHQQLLLDGQTIQITEIALCRNSELIVVDTDIDRAFTTRYLANFGETVDHQPCGTPVLL